MPLIISIIHKTERSKIIAVNNKIINNEYFILVIISIIIIKSLLLKEIKSIIVEIIG